MSKNKRSRRRNKGRTGLTAATADRHILYQRAVQCVEAEIDMVEDTFKRLRGRRAVRGPARVAGEGGVDARDLEAAQPGGAQPSAVLGAAGPQPS